MKTIFQILMAFYLLGILSNVHANHYPNYEKYLESRTQVLATKGELQFDFKPNWEWTDDKKHSLINIGGFQVFKWYKESTDQNIFIFKYIDIDNTYHEITKRTTGADTNIFGDGSAWLGRWHRITVTWNMEAGNQYIAFDIDGKISSSLRSTWDGVLPLINAKIGHAYWGNADGEFKNLSVKSIAPIFYDPIENADTIASHGGSTIGSPTYTTGISGQGLTLNGGQSLTYSNIQGIDKNKGLISFYFKPSWDWDDSTGPTGGNHQILSTGAINIFKWYKKETFQNIFMVTIKHSNGATTTVSVRTTGLGNNDILGDGSAWKDNWHHIQVTWDSTVDRPQLLFIIDGKQSDFSSFNGTGVANFSVNTSFGLHSWKAANGIFDEFKIYDVTNWDWNDKVSSFIEVTRDNGKWDNHETIYNSSDAQILSSLVAPDENYVFYETPAYERVFEGTLPLNTQVRNEFTYNIAQGEYETLFFNLYTRKDLIDATLSIRNFTGPQNTIISNGKLHVVKNWWQAGSSAHRKLLPEYVPELFLSSDIDGDALNLETGNWTHDKLPSLGTANNSVHTALGAYTSKQFAHILKIPENIPAGTYFATVDLIESGNIVHSFIISIQVDPFVLLDANREYITYHRAQRNINSQLVEQFLQYVPETTYLSELDDMAAHGITGIINYERDPETINTMMEQSINAGINKIIITRSDSSTKPAIINNFINNGLPAWFTGIDEPNRAKDIDDHINLSDDIHDIGGFVFTAIQVEYVNRLINDAFDFNDPTSVYYDNPSSNEVSIDADVTEKQAVDLSNIALNGLGADEYFTSLLNDPNSNAPDQTFYWQSMQENPLINRSFTGFYLWNTGMAGVAPYVYQDVRGNPYNDWDSFSVRATTLRDHLTAYPSLQGPVTTMQWEAFREGIDDLRYLQTWNYYYQQLILINPAAALVHKNIIDIILNNYKTGYTESSVPKNITAKQFSDDRNTIRHLINSIISYLNYKNSRLEK